jgi:uncharacterized protein YuzE
MAQQEIVNNFNIQYDPEADVLYCSFGPPQDAISIEVEEDLFVRVNAAEVPVGMTMVNFTKRFAFGNHQPVSIPIQVSAPVFASRFSSVGGK